MVLYMFCQNRKTTLIYLHTWGMWQIRAGRKTSAGKGILSCCFLFLGLLRGSHAHMLGCKDTVSIKLGTLGRPGVHRWLVLSLSSGFLHMTDAD